MEENKSLAEELFPIMKNLADSDRADSLIQIIAGYEDFPTSSVAISFAEEAISIYKQNGLHPNDQKIMRARYWLAQHLALDGNFTRASEEGLLVRNCLGANNARDQYGDIEWHMVEWLARAGAHKKSVALAQILNDEMEEEKIREDHQLWNS